MKLAAEEYEGEKQRGTIEEDSTAAFEAFTASYFDLTHYDLRGKKGSSSLAKHNTIGKHESAQCIDRWFGGVS